MKELSMHILDIAQNSVRANASEIWIEVRELVEKNVFEFIIKDNGPGIPDEIFQSIKSPFTTSRTLRRVKVGLGIPLLNDTCELCAGSLNIQTKLGEGTVVHAKMVYHHIDRPPLGDIISTIASIFSSNEERNIHYRHLYNENEFEFETNEIKEVLGDTISLKDMEIYLWLKGFIEENLEEIRQ